MSFQLLGRFGDLPNFSPFTLLDGISSFLNRGLPGHAGNCMRSLVLLARTLWQGTIDAAMEVVFAGEQPLFQQDIGAVTLFCENVRQVLTETGS